MVTLYYDGKAKLGNLGDRNVKNGIKADKIAKLRARSAAAAAPGKYPEDRMGRPSRGGPSGVY